MIISHKHRYIFIHCRKTAGSSISNMLSNSLGLWDIQLSAVSETLELGGDIPLRMWIAALLNSGWRVPVSRMLKRNDLIAMQVKRSYASALGPKPQHATASAVRASFPKEWAMYKKFCVVRNPFSLAVSDYNWRTRNLTAVERPDFLSYLRALEKGDDIGGIVPVGFYNNWQQYAIDDVIVVDEIIRFETLSRDLGQVLSDLNVPFDGQLPKLKEVMRENKKTKPYRNYYNLEALQLVSELYQEEIHEFGYSFDGL